MAESSLNEALLLSRETGGALGEAEILQARAELHMRLGNFDRMNEDAVVAIGICQGLQATSDVQRLGVWLAEQERAAQP